MSLNKNRPIKLLVNGVENPLAIEYDQVLLTWQMDCQKRGEKQTAYQILISSNEKNIYDNCGDVFDSKKVITSQSASIKISGINLQPAKRYWWKVRIWDKQDVVSEFSIPATFDTGLDKSDWVASGIWDGTTNTNNFAYFRKRFLLRSDIKYAKVFVTAHNDYHLFLNGEELGRGPARANPYTYGQYNAYDVTKILKYGNNVFAAIAHWHGEWTDSGVNAMPVFILEARVEYANGDVQIIKTDDTWKTLAQTPYIESEPTYFGEAGGVKNRAAIQYDGRKSIENWIDVSFTDKLWDNSTQIDISSFNLYAQLVSQDYEQQELVPLKIEKIGNEWLVEFDKCINGWPRITMKNNYNGSIVKVSYYQLSGTNAPAGWDQYICAGGKETFVPNFGRHTSFKTLIISGYQGDLSTEDIGAIWAYTGAKVIGNFNCSNSLLNNIFEMCERSARQNVQQGIISVDANREQSPWIADSWNIGNVLLYNHEYTMIIDKTINDYINEQLECGDFYACSPASIFRIPEWSMYIPMIIWQQYLFSGNLELLKNTFINIKKFLEWIGQFKDINTQLINPPSDSWTEGIRFSDYAGGILNSGGYNIATNCQYYENLQIAAKIATLLEETEIALIYEENAIAVKEGINTNLLVNGKKYISKIGDTQAITLGCCWPLRFNIVPEKNRPLVKQYIKEHGDAHIGGYGGDAFYCGLYTAGDMGDYIVNDLNRYKEMLESNNTNWETWNSGEFNHAWTSYPGYIFHKYISGIQPTSGGFENFDINPEVTGLDFAESQIPTVKGTIYTRWEKKSESKMIMSYRIPSNSTAKVFIPKNEWTNIMISEGNTILWNGCPTIYETDDIQYYGEDERSVSFLIGSGSYVFEIINEDLSLQNINSTR